MADRKISDLTALTAPAAGDYLPIVDISEVAAASKNKRITIEELFRGVPLGTAAAPSIAIEGDENTGIYSPGADQLAVATNGTGRLFVNASGNVGVGAVPGARFEVSENAGYLRTSCISTGATLTSNGSLQLTATGAGRDILFAANGANRALLSSSGRLGLGTVSPQSFFNLKLDANSTTPADSASIVLTNKNTTLNGNIAGGIFADGFRDVSDPAYTAGMWFTRNSEAGNLSSSSNIIFGTATTPSTSLPTERLRITSAGLVGIGTSSPGASLDVVSSADIRSTGSFSFDAGNKARLNIGNYTGYNASGGALLTLGLLNVSAVDSGAVFRYTFGLSGAAAGQDLTLSSVVTNGTPTERLRITSTGLVAIGTSSPTTALTVGGVTPALSLTHSFPATNTVGAVISSVRFGDGYTGREATATISAHVDNIWSVGSGATALRFNTAPAGSFTALPRLTIDSNGRVGIGTTSPGSALEINAAAATSPFIAKINTAEVARIDSSGRMLVGTSTSNGAKFEVTETRRLNAQTGASAGWIELTDVANTTSGTLTTFATLSLSSDVGDQAYFRIEVRAGHTGESGYSSAVSIREGLLSGYGGVPRILNSTETRNLTGSVNSGVIATALTTAVAAGSSGTTVTFSFQATATLSGSSSGSAGVPRISYRVSVLTSSNVATATLSSNI